MNLSFSDKIRLLIAVAFGLAIGAFGTLHWLSVEVVRIIGVADNSAAVYVAGKLVARFEGADAKVESIRIRPGQTMRVVAEDHGGPRGFCIILLNNKDRVIAGTTPYLTGSWNEIDEKSGLAKGPAQEATNQVWGKSVSNLTGQECLSLWGGLEEGRVVLETTLR